MDCKKCDNEGYTVEHRTIKVYCRHDRAMVDDFVYYQKPCQCEYGKSFDDRQKTSMISEANRINKFIDKNKRHFRSIKKMLNDYINDGVRHYEGRGRFS